jgi:hypothetical protein
MPRIKAAQSHAPMRFQARSLCTTLASRCRRNHSIYLHASDTTAASGLRCCLSLSACAVAICAVHSPSVYVCGSRATAPSTSALAWRSGRYVMEQRWTRGHRFGRGVCKSRLAQARHAAAAPNESHHALLHAACVLPHLVRLDLRQLLHGLDGGRGVRAGAAKALAPRCQRRPSPAAWLAAWLLSRCQRGGGALSRDCVLSDVGAWCPCSETAGHIASSCSALLNSLDKVRS